jgi:hypothetical protein
MLSAGSLLPARKGLPVENPYASSDFEEFRGQRPFGPMAPTTDPGLVGHVRVVGILSIVEGCLEALMSIFYIVLAFVMPMLISSTNAAPQDPEAEKGLIVVTIIYGSMGVFGLLAGILHIVGGVRMYQFRSRTLGLVSLVAGLAAVFTCYCLPTAAALAIYGLIVMLNPSVVQAFQMRDQGHSPEKILAAFNA